MSYTYMTLFPIFILFSKLYGLVHWIQVLRLKLIMMMASWDTLNSY